MKWQGVWTWPKTMHLMIGYVENQKIVSLNDRSTYRFPAGHGQSYAIKVLSDYRPLWPKLTKSTKENSKNQLQLKWCHYDVLNSLLRLWILDHCFTSLKNSGPFILVFREFENRIKIIGIDWLGGPNSGLD